jgi:hypothetical protein
LKLNEVEQALFEKLRAHRNSIFPQYPIYYDNGVLDEMARDKTTNREELLALDPRPQAYDLFGESFLDIVREHVQSLVEQNVTVVRSFPEKQEFDKELFEALRLHRNKIYSAFRTYIPNEGLTAMPLGNSVCFEAIPGNHF